MNKKIYIKGALILASAIVVLYGLFLILPLLLIPVCDFASNKISAEIASATGFKTELTKFRIVTTPKLTLGAKVDNFKLYTPDNASLADIDKFQVKASLLPLITGKIRIDVISADKIDLNLDVEKNGHFSLEKYFAQGSSSNASGNASAASLPPFLKLSNHLPDIRIKNHTVALNDINTGKSYLITGSNTNVTDFIFNKRVKIQSEGSITLDGFNAFNYDISILNKIMPQFDINELLAQNEQSSGNGSSNNNPFEYNVLEPLNLIKNNEITANLNANAELSGTLNKPEIKGNIVIDKISMLVQNEKLPESNLNVTFKKTKCIIDALLNTAPDEKTVVKGSVNFSKNIDISCNSNATLKNVFNIIKTFARIAGINELNSLSAEGALDANFNIKADKKKVNSDGKIKLSGGKIVWGLYDVKIENIVANILFNDGINIENLGFSTLSIPFTIKGSINKNSVCDIKINTSSLPVKSLLVSLGQGALLKENPISSGTISIDAAIKDKLSAPKITGLVSVDNLAIKNIPADITVKVNPVKINLAAKDNAFSGTINASKIYAINPAITVNIPEIEAAIDDKTINVQTAKVYAGKNELDVYGKISNYMSDKIELLFNTKGEINSTLQGSLNPYKSALNLNYKIPETANIVIPGFDKSKVQVSGALDITGAFENPILKGNFSIPYVEIPEIPVSIKNMTTALNGEILNGNFTITEFASGGIKAQNVKSDYKLKGSDFYLNNLTGSAFDGNFEGSIVYNLQSLICDVILTGKNMNALKAIEGASGIKNALSGTLSFNSNISLKALDYNAMIKSLAGNADFEIKNGTLLNIGGLDRLINAQNIISNTFLKTSVQKAGTLTDIKDASNFDYITGNLTFNNGYAIINPIKMSGALMAYYVTGKLHLLNYSLNAVILGRLAQSVVGNLGSIGSFSTEKISALIPGLGNLTSSIAKSLSESPDDVDTSSIPALKSQNTSYSDFKAVFNGGIESTSSVKSFKWLNNIDTSEIDSTTSVTNTIQNTLNSVKDAAKTNTQNSKEEIKNTIDNTKNLLKGFLK